MFWFLFGKHRPTMRLDRMSYKQRDWHLAFRERFIG